MMPAQLPVQHSLAQTAAARTDAKAEVAPCWTKPGSTDELEKLTSEILH